MEKYFVKSVGTLIVNVEQGTCFALNAVMTLCRYWCIGDPKGCRPLQTFLLF